MKGESSALSAASPGCDLGIPSLQGRVSAEEWRLRVDLAAAYRMVALHGWSDLIYTHISARIPGPENHFLINPYGLLFEEITASSLIRVDQEGRKQQDGFFPTNPAGFIIHSAIHAVRHDVQCVLHTHTRAGVAVSAQEAGLLPISQQSSFVLASLAYHDYEGVALREDEQPRLQNDLGDKTFLCLRNHGLLTVGPSVADAFLAMYFFETACQTQIAAQAGGALRHIDAGIVERLKRAIASPGFEPGGPMVWPALLRKLDRIDPSFRD